MLDRTDQQPENAERETIAVDERRNEQALSTADLAPAGMTSDTTSGGTMAVSSSTQGTTSEADASHTALFPSEEAGKLRSRWDGLQVGFVDDPKQTVEQADQLVAEVMQRLAQIFADERSRLEHHWEQGDQVSTEDLRVALQRYRSFFGRLLKV